MTPLAQARGEISRATIDEFNRASKGKKLPEHVAKRGQDGQAGRKATLAARQSKRRG